MENEELITEAAEEGGLDIDLESIMGTVGDVFGFFQQIIDFLKGIFTPIFESLFSSLLG